jgi:hypothetical protein
MSQVAALREVHAQNRIPRFEDGEIGCHVGLRTGMWLNVHMFGTKDLFAALDGQLFNGVHVLAATIIAFTGIAFGIFVRHEGALRRQHCWTGEVFRGDQQQLVALSFLFGIDGGVDLGIGGLQGVKGAHCIFHGHEGASLVLRGSGFGFLFLHHAHGDCSSHLTR